MKLTQFKKDCEAVGLDWKLVKKRTKEEMNNFEQLLADMDCPEDILFDGFIWENTPEGRKFWYKQHLNLGKTTIVAKAGVVCEYMIERHNSDWLVGCQRITPKQQLKLFKLLADDLGLNHLRKLSNEIL